MTDANALVKSYFNQVEVTPAGLVAAAFRVLLSAEQGRPGSSAPLPHLAATTTNEGDETVQIPVGAPSTIAARALIAAAQHPDAWPGTYGQFLLYSSDLDRDQLIELIAVLTAVLTPTQQATDVLERIAGT
jgi:hypothetical protein